MRCIESQSFGNWNYSRYELESGFLGKPARFGILAPSDESAPISDTVYFFHGGGADDRQAIEVGLQEGLPARRFRIVLPSIENSFLAKAYHRFFFEELLPRAESVGTPTGDVPPRRFVTGNSMGGAAALSAFFKKPHEFSGVGASFPVLMPCNLWNALDAASYARTVNLADGLMPLLTGLYQSQFSDLADFQEWDPLTLARTTSFEALRGRKIELSVGLADEYGLYEGCRVLSETLFRRDIPHRLEQVEGGKHDASMLKTSFPKILSSLLA